jgi:DNA anti-recombination protein RmuC
VLIPIGAALEARDLVADAIENVVSASTGAIDDLRAATGSRRALDRQLKKFERRGGKARTELERDLRRTRTRLEREVRHSRGRVERSASDARRDFEHRRAEARRTLEANVESLQSRVAPVRERVAPLTGRVAPVRNRFESVVQNGLDAGRRFVEDAQDRIAKVA